jgi:omega-hydroxy-beta-dihydromenaquinone-9 sulfotransferase
MRTWRERLQLFTGPGILAGISLRDWIQVLGRNEVDISFWLRAAAITQSTLMNYLPRRQEANEWVTKLNDVTIQPPIFILGHWRSGTTHLHNLFALDRRLTYPTLYQVLYPHSFLSTEHLALFWAFFLEKRRFMDNMAQDLHTPAEEEFALCNATGLSPYMGFVFPRRSAHYDRYLSFQDVSQSETDAWKAALLLFLEKLTRKAGRQLVLKSPPHTCRIRLLLALFPDARFVHIHRHPYAVYQSTQHWDRIALQVTSLQWVDLKDRPAYLLERYRTMYDRFFEERALIPANRFHDVALEDLEKDPVAQMRTIYERLDLPGFSALEPALRTYTESLRNYRQNEHPELPAAVRQRIAKTWQRSFDEWRYGNALY